MRNSSVSSAIPFSEITMCSSLMRIDHRCGHGRKQSFAGEIADSAASISRRLRAFDYFPRTLYKIKKIQPARQNLWSWPAHLSPYVSSDAQLESSAPQRLDFRHLTPIGLFRQTADECGFRLTATSETSPIDYSQPQSYTPKYLADQILMAEIHEYEGTINQFTGDGVKPC